MRHILLVYEWSSLHMPDDIGAANKNVLNLQVLVPSILNTRNWSSLQTPWCLASSTVIITKVATFILFFCGIQKTCITIAQPMSRQNGLRNLVRWSSQSINNTVCFNHLKPMWNRSVQPRKFKILTVRRLILPPDDIKLNTAMPHQQLLYTSIDYDNIGFIKKRLHRWLYIMCIVVFVCFGRRHLYHWLCASNPPSLQASETWSATGHMNYASCGDVIRLQSEILAYVETLGQQKYGHLIQAISVWVWCAKWLYTSDQVALGLDSYNQQLDCLLSSLFRSTTRKLYNFAFLALCEGNHRQGPVVR